MFQISSRNGSLVCYEMYSLFYNFLSTAAVMVCPDNAAPFVRDKAAVLRERQMRLSVLTDNRVCFMEYLESGKKSKQVKKRTGLPAIKYLYTYDTSTCILIQSAGKSTGIIRLILPRRVSAQIQ